MTQSSVHGNMNSCFASFTFFGGLLFILLAALLPNNIPDNTICCKHYSNNKQFCIDKKSHDDKHIDSHRFHLLYLATIYLFGCLLFVTCTAYDAAEEQAPLALIFVIAGYLCTIGLAWAALIISANTTCSHKHTHIQLGNAFQLMNSHDKGRFALVWFIAISLPATLLFSCCFFLLQPHLQSTYV